jgi:hypothetical protein
MALIFNNIPVASITEGNAEIYRVLFKKAREYRDKYNVSVWALAEELQMYPSYLQTDIIVPSDDVVKRMLRVCQMPAIYDDPDRALKGACLDFWLTHRRTLVKLGVTSVSADANPILYLSRELPDISDGTDCKYVKMCKFLHRLSDKKIKFKNATFMIQRDD